MNLAGSKRYLDYMTPVEQSAVDSAPGPQAFENLLNNIDPSRLVENRIFNDNPGFLKLLSGMGGMGMMG